MKLHELKIRREYAKAKLKGIKSFEIRKNDRDYQVGDLVRYVIPCPIDTEDKMLNEVISKDIYQIMYITDYEQKDNYIVFTDKVVARVELLGE